MKQKLIAALAVLMSVVVVFSSYMTVRYLPVYAEEGDDFGDDGDYSTGLDWVDNDDGEEDDPAPDPDPTAQPTAQPAPFDYSLTTYSPYIDFGTVNKGDYIPAKQFTVINTGTTDVPLAYYIMDPYNAFSVDAPDEILRPGDQATFYVYPNQNLDVGSYFTTFTIGSGNDIRQTNAITVRFDMDVIDNLPYVSSVTVSPGRVDLPTGKTYNFSASVSGYGSYNPAVTWSVAGYSSANTGIDSNGKLTVGSDEVGTTLTVTATSVQDPDIWSAAVVNVTRSDHMVSVRANPSEGGNVSGGGSLRDGGSTTLYQSANNNYRFTGWYENNTKISDGSQLYLNNVTSDRNIEARYDRVSCYVKTSVNNSNGGTISGGGSVDYGGKMTITAKANSGYAFEGFVENNKIISTSTSLELNNITSNRDIMASFKQSRFDVNISCYPGNGGTVTGYGTYDAGKNVELTAKPNSGFDFISWTINGQVVSNSEKYTINSIGSDVSIVANFAVHNTPQYKISSYIANQGGGIVPSGDNYVAEGNSAVYNIVPLDGYRILAVAVDGKNIGAVSSYSFTNVKGAHSIAASFAKIEDKNDKKKKTNTSDDMATPTPETTPKTPAEYNHNSAASGALPEQVIKDDGTLPTDESELAKYDIPVNTDTADALNSDLPWVPDDENSNATGGVLLKYGISEDYALKLMDTSADQPLLRMAYEDGYLNITVNNSFAKDVQETALGLYHDEPTLLNFEDVICDVLTEEEKLSILEGNTASFNVDITENTEFVRDDIKKLMQKKVGYKALSYFDFVILKTINSDSSIVFNTDKDLEVTIKIPDSIKKTGRNYCILREHNGTVDVLHNLSDDPDYITFKTNKFSEYAIAYEAINVNVLMAIFLGVTVLAMIIATICFAHLIRYRVMNKKKRRRTV